MEKDVMMLMVRMVGKYYNYIRWNDMNYIVPMCWKVPTM
jgi:hypothetical protein